jgi:demethylmenaquinone methyltransferase / 2-methoxy-6-polyprenyl-1,4-benzoquinol methylase
MGTAIKPYSEEGSKKQQVEEMFDNIAGSYDFLNRLLSLRIDVYWRKVAINLLKDLNPKVILDVATGTADTAIELTKRLSPEKIIGIDISNKMLDVGRVKIKDKNLTSIIELQQADSENLPFEPNTFDAATITFGIRNFENVEKGLSEIHRCLRPGGRLMILEFARPRIFPLKQLFNIYFKYVLPLIGKMTSKDPRAYTYLYESVQAFPDRENFVALMDKTGYKNTNFKSLTTGICCIYLGEK